MRHDDRERHWRLLDHFLRLLVWTTLTYLLWPASTRSLALWGLGVLWLMWSFWAVCELLFAVLARRHGW